MCIKIVFLLFLILLFTIIANATTESTEYKWEMFKTVYKKTYETSHEHDKRKAIFIQNLKKIEKHNERYEQKQESYMQGVTLYADLTCKEFRHYSKCIDYNKEAQKAWNELDIATFNWTMEKVPEEIDWTTIGAVTSIKGQWNCGSCWAFSSVATIEGAYYIKTNNLVELSQQHLIDCTDANHGCRGGWPTLAFEYVIKNLGIAKESRYPYEAMESECRYKLDQVGARIFLQNKLPYGNEDILKVAVAKFGPVSVAVDNQCFRFYNKGIMNCKPCETDHPRHAVTIVGYGTENGKDYWLIKNSWGPTWGLRGYGKMSRNKNNQCGIASFGVFVTA